MCIYLYDNDGSPIGMQYRTTSYAEGVFDTFWFTKNVHGDIVSVYNDAGTKLLTYHYDAWGNVSTQWHTYYGSDYYASYNPFKYRGYYHDSETGFYYLNSRYYDPATGRFINADSLLNQNSVLGTNLYAYCLNNPVCMTDETGDLPLFAITAAVCAVLGAVAGGIIAAKTDNNVWAGIGIGAAGGALLGCGVGAGLGMISGFGAAATASQVATGLGAIATGTGAAISSSVVPAAEKAKQVFWAGGDMASKAADTFANLTQTCSTIANTPAGREILAQTSGLPWEQAKPMWEAASLQFAQQASGTVNVFIYAPNFSSSSIFITTELPALLSNPNVNEIIIHIFGG